MSWHDIFMIMLCAVIGFSTSVVVAWIVSQIFFEIRRWYENGKRSFRKRTR